MINLIERYGNDNQIKQGIKNLNLLYEFGDLKKGDVITFYAGYNSDILYKSMITGFDQDGDIYVLWDCYWSPIRLNDVNRKIKKVN